MNTYFKTLTFWLISLVAFAQTSVKWEPNISQALSKAKANNKVVFVYAYLVDCPACQSVAPFWNNPEIAKKFNDGFVNYKLNLAVAEQVKFLNDRNLRMPSYPQLMFFDANGNLIHQTTDVLPPSIEKLIGVANEGLDSNQWSSNYKKRYVAGDRDYTFLKKLAKYSVFMKDFEMNHKAANDLFEMYPKNELNSISSYILLRDIVTDVDNGFFQYWIKNLNSAADIERNYGGKVGGEKESLGKVISFSVMDSSSRNFSTEKLARIREYMKTVGAEEHADIVLWEPELLANLREGNKNQALEIGNKLSVKSPVNGPFLIYVSKVYTDVFPDNQYIPWAKNWLKMARPLLKQNSYLADFYFESARINQKENNAIEAKKNATEALKYAKLAKSDTRKFDALLGGL